MRTRIVTTAIQLVFVLGTAAGASSCSTKSTSAQDVAIADTADTTTAVDQVQTDLQHDTANDLAPSDQIPSDQRTQDGALAELDSGSDAYSAEAACDGDTSLVQIEHPASVGKWGRFEAVISEDLQHENPFDPGQIRMWALFESPSGKQVPVDAFWFQDFDRVADDSGETLTAKGPAGWRLRFTPTQEGPWRFLLLASLPGSTRCSDWMDLMVGPADASSHGFLRRADPGVTGTAPRHLAFDDKTPFLAIGQNVGWADGRGTGAYEEWFSQMATHGANYARLWMASWGFSIETWDGSCTVPSCSRLGDYSSGLERAWQLDRVISLAEENGLMLMLCVLNHGLFSLTSNSEWATNPYNRQAGGFLDTPQEFFTDTQARELLKQRLRYIVARWGYSRNLLAWELFNEVDLTEQKDPDVLGPWHAEMAAWLKELDPYGHLVTSSTASLGALLGIDQAIFSLPDIDLVQFHIYGREGFTIEFAKQLPKQIAQNQVFLKPVLVGEVWVNFSGPNETLASDPSFVGHHDYLWIPIAAGAWGTGMGWWWDSVVHPNGLYSHFAPIKTWTQGVDFAAQQWQTVQQKITSGSSPVDLLAQVGQKDILVWIKNSQNQYFQPLNDDSVTGVQATLPVGSDGPWQAQWIDPWGAPLESPLTLQSSQGSVVIVVPPFKRDIALRLTLAVPQ